MSGGRNIWLWLEMTGLVVIGILLVIGSIIALPGRLVEAFAKDLLRTLERYCGEHK